ncbi:MAG: hypothetical protein ACI8ZT_002142, partial [Bacteroidia bacterium]
RGRQIPALAGFVILFFSKYYNRRKKMSRWLIEKSGTGIEKSGTGIEKSGTGIEKSGTGIEKSGTGIEKFGSGIRKSVFCFAVVMLSFASQVSAVNNDSPAGVMQLVVNGENIAVSWIIDGSVFSGVGSLSGSFANIALTEIGLAKSNQISSQENYDAQPEVVASGTGKDVVASGTGKDVVASGTGKDVVASGTGKDVVASGTGADVVASGTGADVVASGTGADVVASGTGADVVTSGTGADVVASGTGADVVASGTGTHFVDSSGSDSIIITLPGGTDMQMEVALGCNSATVSVMDSNFSEIVSFDNVPVFGASGYCSGGSQGFGGYFDPKMPTEFGARK